MSNTLPMLISGATIVNPEARRAARGDVLIENGRIAAVGAGVAKAVRARPGMRTVLQEVDATGLVLAPGFVDIHTHLREPGGEASETIETGTRSAAAGGFTAVLCMPNTNPAIDTPMVVEHVLRRAEGADCRVVPVAAVTRGQQGETLADLSALVKAGAGALSDDGRPVMNARLMLVAMQMARELNVPILDHCEDMNLTNEGVMNEGAVSARLGLRGIPRTSEAVMAARDIMLAEAAGAHVHICHVSTRETVQAVREGKARGARVTAEASPHHLTLTEERVGDYDTHAKMKPPLCEEADRQALIEGVEDGTIDIIATDHAPHSPASKSGLFDDAPFGILGFETAFSVLHDAFVRTGRWTLEFLIRRMTLEPARIVGKDWGTLRVGAPADVVLLETGRGWTYRAQDIRSKSRNSPWVGQQFHSRIAATLLGGRPTWFCPAVFAGGLSEGGAPRR